MLEIAVSYFSLCSSNLLSRYTGLGSSSVPSVNFIKAKTSDQLQLWQCFFMAPS